jgi:glyoxylase I family protein
VRDLEAAAAYLREHGLQVLERIDIDDGPAAGQHVRYVLDPWGNQLELIEWDR